MNNVRKLEETGRGWWTADEISSILGLPPPQRAVFCTRAVKRGELIRIKRGIYMLPRWTSKASEDEIFYLSNILQTPSYISFTTAMSRAGITTQFQVSECEAASPVRSASFETEGTVFRFYHIPDELFCEFERQGQFFIARPEKAFLDAVYLASLGRYAMDLAALDLGRLDAKRLEKIGRLFPKRARDFMKRITEGK